MNPSRKDGNDPLVPQPLCITLTLDPRTNQLRIDGPLADGVVFLGMLELAKDVWREWKRTQVKTDGPRIVGAHSIPKA